MLCCCTGNPFHRAPILLKPIACSCDSVLDANCGVVCVLYKLQLLFLRFYRVILKKWRGQTKETLFCFASTNLLQRLQRVGSCRRSAGPLLNRQDLPCATAAAALENSSIFWPGQNILSQNYSCTPEYPNYSQLYRSLPHLKYWRCCI